MDRLYYLEISNLSGETVIYSCKGIRLYDGDAKVDLNLKMPLQNYCFPCINLPFFLSV